jgi:hypothetical protein
MPTVTLAAPSGRYLSFTEREEIAMLRAGGSRGGRSRSSSVDRRRHRPAGLLLRSAKPVAARHQREHQRALRQYFPKGTDLARHSLDDLVAVAAALNTRPRKTLGWRTPAEVLDEYLTPAA